MSDVLEEMVLEILKKLPVKKLLVCRTVCKQWKNLISEPTLAKSHFQSAIKNQTINCSLLLSVSTDIPQLESLELDHRPLRNRANTLKLTSPVNLGKPNRHHQVLLLGSSNGIVCACVSYEVLFIWYPLTGVSQRLRFPQFPTQRIFLVFHGFGYVSSSKDYKLILSAMTLDLSERSMEVQVFSVRKDKWKSMEACITHRLA